MNRNEYFGNLLTQYINVMLEHPGKTIKWSEKGIEALETDAPPYLIIVSKRKKLFSE